MGAKQAFIRKFWYMLGVGWSKPSLGSLDVCWEWDGASLHWGVWVVLGGGRSKPSLGWVYVGREAEQAFTREFGYMLGGMRSKSSLEIWMENFILRRMHVFGCIGGGGGGGGGAKQAFTRGGASLLLGVRQKTLCCRSFIYQ